MRLEPGASGIFAAEEARILASFIDDPDAGVHPDEPPAAGVGPQADGRLAIGALRRGWTLGEFLRELLMRARARRRTGETPPISTLQFEIGLFSGRVVRVDDQADAPERPSTMNGDVLEAAFAK